MFGWTLFEISPNDLNIWIQEYGSVVEVREDIVHRELDEADAKRNDEPNHSHQSVIYLIHSGPMENIQISTGAILHCRNRSSMI